MLRRPGSSACRTGDLRPDRSERQGLRTGGAFLIEGSPSAVLGPTPCMARRLVSIIARYASTLASPDLTIATGSSAETPRLLFCLILAASARRCSTPGAFGAAGEGSRPQPPSMTIWTASRHGMSFFMPPL